MAYFPRMLDKIRLHARGELGADYHENLGSATALDGVCCNFLRMKYDELRERVLQGGSDEEILEWCFEKGRRLNEGDLFVWNSRSNRFRRKTAELTSWRVHRLIPARSSLCPS